MQFSLNAGTPSTRFRIVSLIAVAALFSACADPIAAPSASPTLARLPIVGGNAENNQSCEKSGVNGKSANEKNQCGTPAIPAVAIVTNNSAGAVQYGAFNRTAAEYTYWTCGDGANVVYGSLLAGATGSLTACDPTQPVTSAIIYIAAITADANYANLASPINVAAPGATCTAQDLSNEFEIDVSNDRAWLCSIPLVNGKPAATVQITVTPR
jgi:hypothetical protein